MSCYHLSGHASIISMIIETQFKADYIHNVNWTICYFEEIVIGSR